MGISFKRKGVKYDPATQERIRQKIADAKVASELIAVWKGEIKKDRDQLMVGLKLLDKIVPNLQSQELTVTDERPFAQLVDVIQDVSEWQDRFTPAAKTEH